MGGNMRPGYIALIFWGLSAFAVFGILKSLRTGVATSVFPYREDQNPGAFMMIILGRMFVIVFAIAETLYAFGLTGDPIAALRSTMPFHQ
jgi:hypothetical protein